MEVEASSETGNTNPLRAWCFTLNNPSEDDERLVRSLADLPHVVRLAVGREVAPTTGTRHLQGYVRFSRGVRFSGVKKLVPRAHIEPRQAKKECQASQYCLKDGDPLIDHGIDSDTDRVTLSRNAEAMEIIGEIEKGLTYGQIRNRHKLFCFWWRRNVREYLTESNEQTTLAQRTPPAAAE